MYVSLGDFLWVFICFIVLTMLQAQEGPVRLSMKIKMVRVSIPTNPVVEQLLLNLLSSVSCNHTAYLSV